MGAFPLRIVIYIINLSTQTNSKLATGFLGYVPFQKKLSLFSVCLVSYCFIFCMVSAFSSKFEVVNVVPAALVKVPAGVYTKLPPFWKFAACSS